MTTDDPFALTAGLGDTTLPARRRRHRAIARRLAAMSDRRLRDLVDGAPVLGSGIGGTRCVLHVDGVPVFVKRVPLTELERRPEHVRSTANLFDLPMCCQYGVGSPSFGVWRELAANEMATSWVVAGRTEGFPLLHHWRVLDSSAPPLADELADMDAAVAYWHGSSAVRRRIEAIAGAPATVTLFLEHLPHTLPAWLERNVTDDGALTMVEHELRDTVAFMNTAGLFHFDAHFDNILTDGHRLYLADFGLATSTSFELSPEESSFLAANASHDACHTVTRLVDWLVTRFAGVAEWQARDAYVAAYADGVADLTDLPPAAAAVIRRYAPIAAVVNEFYRRLHLEDRRTPYPTDEVRRAAATAGFAMPWMTPGPLSSG